MKRTRLSRRAACHTAATAAGIPDYNSDMRPVRGKCRRRSCGARWAVIRVSLDFRDPSRVDRLARTECARCGHVWRRVAVPRITSPAGYQEVRLTLILPASIHRWFSRGRWHREGDDALVIGEATIADLDEAARDHATRAGRIADRIARAKVRRAEADSALHAATMATLAMLAELDAQRAADEAQAAAREDAA